MWIWTVTYIHDPDRIKMKHHLQYLGRKSTCDTIKNWMILLEQSLTADVSLQTTSSTLTVLISDVILAIPPPYHWFQYAVSTVQVISTQKITSLSHLNTHVADNYRTRTIQQYTVRKWSTAVCNQQHQCYRNSHPIRDHGVLPAIQQRWHSHLYPAN